MTSNQEMVNERINDNRKRYKGDLIAIKDLKERHEKIKSFLIDLDKVDSEDIDSVTNSFINYTFPNYNIEYLNLNLPDNTPRSLIKLQIANYEYACLRGGDWDRLVKIDYTRPIIIPDKETFNRNEQITGEVIIATGPSVDEWLDPQIELNGRPLNIKDKKARFSISADSLVKLGQNSIRLITKVSTKDSTYVDTRTVKINK